MKNLLVLCSFFLLISCAATTGLEKGAKLEDPAKEAIIIIGVKPENFHINIMEGDLVDSRFEFSVYVTPTAFVTPTNGYVVLKVPVLEKNKTYAIMRVGEGPLKMTFQCDWPALTFTPEAGKVNYIADIAYTKRSKRILLKGAVSRNSHAAEAFMKTNYPDLNLPFVDKGYQFIKVTNGNCKAYFTNEVNPIEYEE